MKVVHISDTHSMKCQIPECDLLIHTGDWSGRGNEKDVTALAEWLGEHPTRNVIVIAGNHDGAAAENKQFVRDTLKQNGIIYLEDEEITINGVRIYGTPWTPTFFDWWFMASESGLAKKFAGIPEGIDIIATHGPPKGTLDEVIEYNQRLGEQGVIHVGSVALANRIDIVKPRYVLFGHIHEGYGRIEKDGVVYLNSSICTRHYRPTNAPQVFEIEPR